MTPAQRELLERLSRGGSYLRGAAVRTARRLERAGLVALEDNGTLRLGGRGDGERWWCCITDRGRASLKGDGDAVRPEGKGNVIEQELRALLAAAADGDRPLFSAAEVAAASVLDLVEVVLQQRAEYRDDAMRLRKGGLGP